MNLLLLPLGLLGGVVTTLSGMGGGMLLLLVLAALWGLPEALALTTPALLLANAHRTVLFRAHVRRDLVLRLALGLVPGALLGGATLHALPRGVQNGLLVLFTALALLRAGGRLRVALPLRFFAPAGFALGWMAAASGGAGMLLAPLLLAAGLTGSAYLGTVAATAVVMHLSRVGGYSLGGLLHGTHLLRSAVLAAGLLLGNVLGRSVRRRLSERWESRIELGTLLLCTTLSVLGVLR